MWVSDGATYRRKSQNGGNIHVHTDIDLPVAPISNTKPQPTIPLAPLEVRHAVFQELIRLSPASAYPNELINGADGLCSRGLQDPKYHQNYGALPATKQERAALASALRKFVQISFPDYATLHQGVGVVGIPGFWQEPSGLVHIWKPRGYKKPMLVIPYKNAEGFIQACQIRLHPNDVPRGEKKYRWLASPLERNGTSSGTPIHFTFLPKDHPAGTITITEGALKAETLVRYRSTARVIATTGVSCSHTHLIEAARPYHALIAFDSDHRTNAAVCHQLARLIAGRTMDTLKHGLANTTRIVFWEGPKGVDDAAQKGLTFTMLGIPEWFATLTGKSLEEVKRLWLEINFTRETLRTLESRPAANG